MNRSTGGRPTRDEAERLSDKIVEVAARLMLELGYGETSIEAVAHEAGVAKRTLYHRFPDKRTLLAAVIERRRERFLSPVAEISASNEGIEEQLKSIGLHMLDTALTQEAISMKRLVTAEAERIPELAVVAYKNGLEQIITAIATILDREVEHGRLRAIDTKFAAQQFVEMILGPADRCACHALSAYARSARQTHVNSVVDLFLNGCINRSAVSP